MTNSLRKANSPQQILIPRIVAQWIKAWVNFEKHQERFALGKGLFEKVQRSLILSYRNKTRCVNVLRAVIGHPIVLAEIEHKSSPPAFFKTCPHSSSLFRVASDYPRPCICFNRIRIFALHLQRISKRKVTDLKIRIEFDRLP